MRVLSFNQQRYVPAEVISDLYTSATDELLLLVRKHRAAH
eukprot:CAMPEP_0206143474 /NCGR_PEP_ID=MMETSP1473-20131121/20717_1 /ASSEMBLY_ACC=CAM_ASM_001109 /TAXON_ID=1461547 /ORGANISM="Stichococcus sp, Strain RCC1054" /LENGTH=39 /DNA_ID= /DNA_START= /DNA_END= /DNA_ORIENTATION=